MEEVPAEHLVRAEVERALEGRRREPERPVCVHDHDDVRRVRDERRVARFHDLRGTALPHAGVVAHHRALAHHHEQRQDEDDHRHRRDGSADLRPCEVNEHQEGDEHRAVWQHVHERIGRDGRPPDGCRRRPNLLACREREWHVAGHVQHVLQSARQVSPADLRERPHDVSEEHRREPAEQKERNPAAADVVGPGQEHDAEREQQNRVERDVGLAERLLEKIEFCDSRRRPDDEEPEECAEPDDEDRPVEREPRPGHAHRARPEQEQRRCEHRRIEGDEEDVARARERILPTQPRAGGDDGADQVETEGRGHRPPRAPERALGHPPRSGDRYERRREIRRPVREQSEIVLEPGPPAPVSIDTLAATT